MHATAIQLNFQSKLFHMEGILFLKAKGKEEASNQIFHTDLYDYSFFLVIFLNHGEMHLTVKDINNSKGDYVFRCGKPISGGNRNYGCHFTAILANGQRMTLNYLKKMYTKKIKVTIVGTICARNRSLRM